MDQSSGTDSFNVLWGVITSTIISMLKNRLNLSPSIIMHINYVLGGAGSFLYNWLALNQDWKQSLAGAVVSLFSSLGWYKAVSQNLRDNLNDSKLTK